MDNKSELVFLPLGGVGEIGMNLALYGYGPKSKREWIMVDCGVTFPGPSLPGVDLVLPDISFVQELGDALKAIIITHAHEDHYGAVLSLWPLLRKPLWCTPFTAGMLEAKLQSDSIGEPLPMNVFKAGDKFNVGPFEIEAVHVTHSIPEPVSLAIKSPLGKIIHTGDWKIDAEPTLGAPTDEATFRRLGKEGILALICDSTNAMREGDSPTETVVSGSIAKVIERAKGRVAITTFSSNVGRIRSITIAAESVGRGRDVVVIEGGANFREGYVVDLSPVETVNLLNAQVVTVVGYRSSLQVVDDALTAATRLGDRLVGVLINAIPQDREEYVNNLVKPYLKKQNINVLATMPFKKRLRAVDVGEIVHSISGELICYDCLDDLVENLVVASMGVEHTIDQFRQVENKAVIVGGDRPDIQIDALETSTKVLILTGNLRPTPMIQEQADLLGVAIILSPFDTLTTIEKVERIFEKSRFHQLEKVKSFQHLLSQNMDFEQFYRKIGLEK